MAGILKFNNVEVLDSNANYIGTIGSSATIPDSLVPSGTGAFLASFTGTTWVESVADNTILPFNDDSTGSRFDTDNNYNTTTYKYEVPATGVYLFYYGIYTAKDDTGNAFGFETNNGEVDNQSDGANFFTQKTGSNDHIQTATLIFPLTSGDTIWIETKTASDYYQGHSYWGGCRLK